MTFKKKGIIGFFPEIVTGVGQILDITGSYGDGLYDKYLKTSSEQLDREALQSDWQAVGKDLAGAMESYGHKTK